MDDGVYATARCHRFIIRFFCPCAEDRRPLYVRLADCGKVWLGLRAKIVIH